MDKHFDGKKPKDIETASETLIPSPGFTAYIANMTGSLKKSGITDTLTGAGDFDNFIEKRK